MLSKVTFNAREDIDNIVSQLTQKATDANDHLVIEAADKVKVFADHDRFVQVMFNIVQNAIQFTQDGMITITAKWLSPDRICGQRYRDRNDPRSSEEHLGTIL